MLTAEGSAARRERLWNALPAACDVLIIAEPEHLIYFAGYVPSPFVFRTGSLAPSVTPMARIPPNGGEQAQWQAKQVLDLGAYGIIWPHISTVAQAYNAVAACRYPRLKTAPRYEPAGIRGDGPTTATRYWGLTQQEYYKKAGVWPLDPDATYTNGG